MGTGAREAADRAERIDTVDENGAQAAIDALAFVLETIGEFTFDLSDLSGDEIRALARQWSEHLMAASRTRHPVQWERFRAFFRPLRQREHASINRNLGELRATVRMLADRIRGAISDDRDGDTHIHASLGALEQTLQCDDIARVREEAVRAIEGIGTVLADRRKRQDRHLLQIQELQEKLARAQRAADRDALTHLLNRRAFDREIRQRAKRRRKGREQCLLMLDADHFKRLNDAHGHPAGDAVLKAIADQCRRTFERQDDVLARFGGEEFAILADVDHEDSAYALAVRLLLAIRRLRVQHADRTMQVTVSIGIATLRPEDDVASWLDRADAALYKAKHDGRDRVAVADEE